MSSKKSKTGQTGSSELGIVGDVGATKTLLGLVALYRTRPKLLLVRRYPSKRLRSLAGPVKALLKESARYGRLPREACIAAAGPVLRPGFVRLTNLPTLAISGSALSAATGLKVKLVNDLAASIAALPLLGRDDFIVLRKGRAATIARPALMLAPGTGLGVALALDDRVLSSEAGHALLAARDTREWTILTKLRKTLKRKQLDLERGLSGPGLVAIYRALGGRTLKRSEKIVAAASRQKLCDKALSIFCGLYGSFTRDLVFVTLSRAVWLAGFSSALFPWLGRDFLANFYSCDRAGEILKKVGIYVITNPELALLGAARLLWQKKGRAMT